MIFQEEFLDIIQKLQALTSEEKILQKDFLQRINKGKFTQAEDSVSHFGVFFWPYNPKTKEIFITHHKKSGLWLAPGGHMEPGELPVDTAIREAKEELGCLVDSLDPLPFMISKTPVNMPGYACRTHYEIWYVLHVLPTDGKSFTVDPQEFFDTKWVSMQEANKFLTQLNQQKALRKLQARTNH